MTSDNPIIYLDNAATTFPKPEAVYQAMDSFYRNYGGNAGRGANPLARKGAGLVEETRALLQQILTVPQVIFTPSSTIALNMAILGAGLRAGDVVYVSPFEHNSVLRPLEHLRQTVGIRVEKLPFNRNTFECKLDEVAALFKLEPPAMVCISQVSNVLGVILPVDEITRLAKSASDRAITVVDVSQSAGLLPVDTSRVNALVFSGHKALYGPFGIAGIGFGTAAWRPSPLFMGGTGTQSESIEMPQSGPSRFESGSQNIHAMAGLNAALKWLEETGRENIHQHTLSLTRQLNEALADIYGITLHVSSSPDLHFGVISFSLEGVMPQAVETALGASNIAVRAGLHCSPWTHAFIKSTSFGGTVRVSVGHFNTDDDIRTLLDVLEQIVYA